MTIATRHFAHTLTTRTIRSALPVVAVSTNITDQTAAIAVDALQYEKLALSAFDLCDRQVAQLETFIALASSIVRHPAITRDERRHRQTLIEVLLDTAEHYQQELQCDRELFQVIALDAKDVAHSRITAHQATKLLAEASQRAPTSTASESALRRKVKSAKPAVTLTTNLTRPQKTAPH